MIEYWLDHLGAEDFPLFDAASIDNVTVAWPNVFLFASTGDGRRPVVHRFSEGAGGAPADPSIVSVDQALVLRMAKLSARVMAEQRPIHEVKGMVTPDGENNVGIIALPLSSGRRGVDQVLCHTYLAEPA